MAGFRKNDRVVHRFGWKGTVQHGRIRQRDNRISVQPDDDEPIHVLVSMLEREA